MRASGTCKLLSIDVIHRISIISSNSGQILPLRWRWAFKSQTTFGLRLCSLTPLPIARIAFMPCMSWLGGGKNVWPVLSDEVLARLSFWSEVQIDLHMVQLMPLSSHHLCFSKIRNGLNVWCRLTRVLQERKDLKRVVVTDRISKGGNAVVSVRPSIRLFPLCLRNRLTVDLSLLRVSILTVARRGLKVKVIGQGQGHGSG